MASTQESNETRLVLPDPLIYLRFVLLRAKASYHGTYSYATGDMLCAQWDGGTLRQRTTASTCSVPQRG
jgi:hypothetical protein